MKRIYLSVVIPIYNEEKIVKKNVLTIIKYLDHKVPSWEIILVNDGSSDKTLEVVKKLKEKLKNVTIVNLKNNMGKGAAIRNGMKIVKGDYVVFMDIDLATPLKHLESLLKYLSSGYDVVIGTRRAKKSKVIVPQPRIREFLGTGFTFITRLILATNVSDFTCGFKGFSKVASKKVFPKAKIDRWSFDAEILFLAKKYELKITEVPVIWKDRRETRVRLWPDMPQSFFDLIRIRLWHFRGKYK